MFWSTLVTFAALAKAVPSPSIESIKYTQDAQAGSTMLRFGCSQITVDRIDPLVNPDLIPSPHMHQIIGGNAFNASIASTDVSTLATCTSCNFADDFSNYWTANLYFKARNGSYKRVPQIPNRYVPCSVAWFNPPYLYFYVSLDPSSATNLVLK